MENILWAYDMVWDKHPNMDEGTEKKLKALELLMRYSGLPITPRKGDGLGITHGA